MRLDRPNQYMPPRSAPDLRPATRCPWTDAVVWGGRRDPELHTQDTEPTAAREDDRQAGRAPWAGSRPHSCGPPPRPGAEPLAAGGGRRSRGGGRAALGGAREPCCAARPRMCPLRLGRPSAARRGPCSGAGGPGGPRRGRGPVPVRSAARPLARVWRAEVSCRALPQGRERSPLLPAGTERLCRIR